MFKEIFLFEIKNGFKKPSTFIYFGLFFLLTLMIGMVGAGVFPGSRIDTNTLINSQYRISRLLAGAGVSMIGLIMNIILISVVATAIQKDFVYNMHSLFYTKPVTKTGYFFGRYLGAMVLAIFIFSGWMFGYMLGTSFAIGKPIYAPFNIWHYIKPFLIFTIPSILLLGAIFFSLTTFTRKTMPAYIAAIILLVFQIVAGIIGNKPEFKETAALLEPTGAMAFDTLTQYWTPSDKNNKVVELTGVLLNNRLIWYAVALILTSLCFSFFRFSQTPDLLQIFKRKNESDTEVRPQLYDSIANLPVPSRFFGGKAAWQQFIYLVKYELKRILRSPFFIILCLLAVGLFVTSLYLQQNLLGAGQYPVTYSMLNHVATFSALYLVFMLFYSGNFLWRDREAKMDELVGVTPVTNGQLFYSKVTALALGFLPFVLLGILGAMIYQVSTGFYHLNVPQYLVYLFTSFFGVLLTAALFVSLQSYVSGKYIGMAIIFVVVFLLPMAVSLLNWRGDLIIFDSDGPDLPYSDLNGYGRSFTVWPIYKIYWLGITGLLTLFGIVLLARGKEKSVKARWKLSVSEWVNKHRLASVILSLAALGAGAFIAWQLFFLEDNTSVKSMQKQQAESEKAYKRYEKMAQPRIVAADINMDIFPSSNSLSVNGEYTLKNISATGIDTLFIDYPGGKKSTYHFDTLAPSVAASVVKMDQPNGVKIFKLSQPLLPGDSLKFLFKLRLLPNSFFGRIGSPVIGNGTFVNNFMFPSIGYNPQGELTENVVRKDHGLPPKPRLAPANDSAARMNNFISRDADWMRFSTTVSTDEGQLAIAPGYLQREWKIGGRHYFEYKMDSPILNFYSFLSAKHISQKDSWNNVAIEVFFNKGHEYNVSKMIRSVKKSLEYYSQHFGPYQHRQLRIIEFPNYSSFAQSFPNTVPYSESIGFLTKVKEGPDDIDLPFYVTAHEVAHQWWGHQVIGGNVQGSQIMSETLSQYAALMVMEKEYGPNSMRKFLEYEMNKYLMSRTFEGKGELPLVLAENQQYIHYNKGSVVMYALKDYLGEEKVNLALRNYLNEFKFKGPMYSNSYDLLRNIKAVTPDSLQYLVTDLFEKITVYENYVKNATYKKLPSGKYEVTLTVGSAKYDADSVGKETRVKNNTDIIEIGILKARNSNTGQEQPLYLQKVKMDAPEKTFVIVVDEQPEKAGIDPFLKLMDKTPANNTMKFGDSPPKVDLSEGAKGSFKMNF